MKPDEKLISQSIQYTARMFKLRKDIVQNTEGERREFYISRCNLGQARLLAPYSRRGESSRPSAVSAKLHEVDPHSVGVLALVREGPS
jgi:hypothetical protein